MTASNTTYCNICKAEFNIAKDTLREERVTLIKSSDGAVINKKVTLTYILCPHCGKTYPVLMDDEGTLLILQELRACLLRRVKFLTAKKPVPQKLQHKYERLNTKLDFKRQKLAEEFDGAFYQYEGDMIQLDYRYRAR